jgi:hypothetical protein
MFQNINNVMHFKITCSKKSQDFQNPSEIHINNRLKDM